MRKQALPGVKVGSCQLGHDARLTLSTYGQVIDELEDLPRIDAETAIAEARATLAREEPPTEASGRS
ncbi:MAG: hypothetical protein M3065_00475 [Actinomycetota bacterium]|nr:hypothetical protein [Actinomycetota bacterium]